MPSKPGCCSNHHSELLHSLLVHARLGSLVEITAGPQDGHSPALDAIGVRLIDVAALVVA